MARGQAEAAGNQLKLTNQVAGQYGQQMGQLYGQLVPQYMQEVTNPGYDPATKAAMTNEGMGAVNAAYGSAGEEAARRAARTRNQAGAGALQEALARNRGLAAGQEASGLQKQFADYRDQMRQAGLRGLQGLYGTGADVMTRMYGLSPDILKARAAGSSSWMSNLGGLLSGIGNFAKGMGGGGSNS